jgi:hypothetical protein
MEAISRINLPELALQSSDSVSLTTRSGPQLPAEQVETLGRLMAQTQARYPNQQLSEGTPDMYLAEWEEMTLTHGLETFRSALLRVMRASRFFPDPMDIREACKSIREEQRSRRQIDKLNAEAEHRKKHPEEYVSMKDLLEEVRQRRCAAAAGGA